MTGHAILWRRLDRPGHEFVRLSAANGGWRLSGSAAFLHDGDACLLAYDVECDGEWRTVGGRVDGWVGNRRISVTVAVDRDGRWSLNGAESPGVAGCVDLDLNFSASTNLLPIRRLRLDVGEESRVNAAWLRFPSFELEPLDQIYRRTGVDTYRYESGGGRFTADLEVDGDGLVTLYPGLCEVETTA